MCPPPPSRGFVAQQGQCGGSGRREPQPPHPTPSWVTGAWGFGSKNSLSDVLESEGCLAPQEESPKASQDCPGGLVPWQAWGDTSCHPRPSLPLCLSVYSFDPVLCSCRPYFEQSPVPAPSVPPCPIPKKISYHCICNLWIRGLSIYYYWLIIINYVILPPICCFGFQR